MTTMAAIAPTRENGFANYQGCVVTPVKIKMFWLLRKFSNYLIPLCTIWLKLAEK
jgi:hypothetical protein